VNNVRFIIASLGLALAAGCKSGSEPQPRAGITEVNPATRSLPANTVVSPNVQVKLLDASGTPMVGASVQFSIALGGGTLTGPTTVTTDANGVATAPVWRLGKSANGNFGQILRAKSGALDSLDIKATAASSYNLVVRFYDDNTMTAGQKALFTLAAQRIMGVITGDEASVTLTNQDISSCLKQSPNTTILTEQIDDLVVYATVKPIDGPNNVIASAGPCFVRNPGFTPILGVMTFDAADFSGLAGGGASLQEVITHEMLHVTGVGSLWHSHSGTCDPPTCRTFIDSTNTTNPLYNAPEARAACVALGGTNTCATRVPVEGCLGIPECSPVPDTTNGTGTRDSHWRESVFASELMTGFYGSGAAPFSSITIGALKDLGYTVNAAGNDDYTIPGGTIAPTALRALGPVTPTMRPGWERLNTTPLYSIDRAGNIRLIRRAR
jgi:hypothetical protein